MNACALRITVFLAAVMLGWQAAQAASITWTGGSGGTGTSWNNSANWGGSVPGTNDTAVFASAGITNNKTISLDASQAVYAVTISNTTSFTIGSANDATATNSLTLVNVNRPSTSANTHTIRAPVVLASNSTWTVAGSGSLVVTNQISGGSYSLTKDGAGELDMSVANSYGTTYILAGSIKHKVKVQIIPGDLVVGGGSSAAAFDDSVATTDNILIPDTATITAKTNGTIYLATSETVKSWVTYSGGTINCINPYMNGGNIYMTGGTLSGSSSQMYGTLRGITTYATNATATILLCPIVYASGGYPISVDDGAAPIDLKLTRGLWNGGSSYALTKSGAGLLQITAGSTYVDNSTVVAAGTLLADNNSGSATYTSAVTVAAGATLGGTGFVGGVTGNGGVSLTAGTSTNSMATIWPGTIDPVSGAHIIGALTVGSAGVSNNVTFGKFTRLSVQLGSTPGSCDQLAVNGYLNLGTTANTNYLDVGSAGTAPRPGDYTLVTFSGLTGRFVTVRSAPGVLPNRYYLRYLGTPSGRGNELLNGSVVLSLPSPGSLILMR